MTAAELPNGQPPVQQGQAIDGPDALMALETALCERAAVGLLYHTATHNCIFRTGADERLYGREAVISHCMSFLNQCSGQQLGEHSAFASDNPLSPESGQWIISRATVAATHSGDGDLGKPTGKNLSYRTQACYRVANGRIVEFWQFVDRLHQVLQLGQNPHELATRLQKDTSTPQWQPGELNSGNGQRGPESALNSLLSAGSAGQLAGEWLDALNFRRFDLLPGLHSANAILSGPGGRQLNSGEEAARLWLSLFAALPDAQLQPQLLLPDNSGTQVALLWRLSGHHNGPGLTSTPSGNRLNLYGLTQWQLVDGKIAAEWTLFDEIELIRQSLSAKPASLNRL